MASMLGSVCALSAPAPRATASRRLCRPVVCCEAPGDDDGREGDTPANIGERISESVNRLLDTPIIDPTQEGGKNEPEWLRRFKDLVATDYQLAETLYAGCVFAVLLFFAQQGVRIYKHCYFMPDKLCPWEVVPSLADELLKL